MLQEFAMTSQCVTLGQEIRQEFSLRVEPRGEKKTLAKSQNSPMITERSVERLGSD
jgi:hypothetical protein